MRPRKDPRERREIRVQTMLTEIEHEAMTRARHTMESEPSEAAFVRYAIKLATEHRLAEADE